MFDKVLNTPLGLHNLSISFKSNIGGLFLLVRNFFRYSSVSADTSIIMNKDK